MNADKFFEKYSIEEISKKTKISPISLRFIRNKEFDKIPRAKFFGFINIIEKEFKVDLSELKEEYNSTKPKEKEKINEIKIEKNNNNYLISIFALILLITGGYFLYKNISKTKQQNHINENNYTAVYVSEKNLTKENKTSFTKIQPVTPKIETNTTKVIKPIKKQQTTKYEITIIPNEKVWYRAKNIDNNKTFEYLTSKIKILPKGNYYIKFGHGNITIQYANQTIAPNTKKIIRILFKDGNYTFLKRPNRYEK